MHPLCYNITSVSLGTIITYSHIRICNILFLLNMLYNILLHGVDTGRYNITIENDSQLQQSLCTFTHLNI